MTLLELGYDRLNGMAPAADIAIPPRMARRGAIALLPLFGGFLPDTRQASLLCDTRPPVPQDTKA
jgi:hypothetical protein